MSQLISSVTEFTANHTDCSLPLRLPQAILSVSREEFYGQDSEHQPLDLIVKKGLTEQQCKLPEDLQGHVFIIGAVGAIDTPKYQGSSHIVEPCKNGSIPIYNGDGMVYRLDFHKTPRRPYVYQSGQSYNVCEEIGKAWMSTRIVKTPDFYADLALSQKSKYQEQWQKEYPWLKFRNCGLARLSLKLGSRNYLNTAFLRMKFSNGTERLLVTWDAGRPYEIDPCTLDLVAPIGWNDQWHPITPLAPKGICPPILSTAHPQFDSQTNEMFTVNACKSFPGLLPLSRLFDFHTQNANHDIKKKYLKNIKNSGFLVSKFIVEKIKYLMEKISVLGYDLIYLNVWRGENTEIEKIPVFLEDGSLMKIEQSLHQMALTKNYIVLSDSAFKLPLYGLIPQLFFKDKKVTKIFNKILDFIRKYLKYPELPYTDLYFISRNQLKQNRAIAKRIRIHPETAHFLANYDDKEGEVILHVGHTAASDPAEFIHRSDCPISDNMLINGGLPASPMDVNRIGCWILDVEKEKVIKKNILSEIDSRNHLWALSLYTGQEIQSQNITNLFWNCWGIYSEILSQSILEMYQKYPNRVVSVSELVHDIIKNGKPANLLRLHIQHSETSDTPELKIEDYYNFPSGYFGNSPQFIPRPDSTEPTDGYIVCVVIYSDNLLSDNTELWIFDAKNLSVGPQYRLSNPRLNMGVTIHTTWLSKLERSPARTDYSVWKDYKDIVENTGCEVIKTLFEEDVYPHFE